MKYLFLILVVLAGCNSESIDKAIDKTNTDTLKTSGKYIGKLSDGRKVHRYEIKTWSDSHYIYVVDSSQSVTNNHRVNLDEDNSYNSVQAEIEY